MRNDSSLKYIFTKDKMEENIFYEYKILFMLVKEMCYTFS